MRNRSALIALATATAALLVVGVAWAVGELTQKPGQAGCISEDGTGGECQDGKALANTFGVAVSPDGKNVYTAAELSEAVGIFDRDPATGTLTQKAGVFGCISESGTGGACEGREGAVPSNQRRREPRRQERLHRCLLLECGGHLRS